MLKSGDSFGSYRVLRLLGKGGMGAVFLLENAEGVQVAAKILDPATAGDHESRKRFLREAELALGVKHPNLVETYDVGEDPDTGLCYILMEYVPGGSLADYLKANGALPVEDAVAVVQAMASVLELARKKGIVHRDIKPGNIMFDAEGTPKLADLGIARGGLAGTETTTVTQTGMMIGTPAYMAPEQMLDAHKVDTRADIYSLGVVFFEMLTGERPNKDDTVVQLMAKAVKGEPLPDVRTLRPEVSASLAQLLSMMVAPDRDGRISTPGQITSALDIIARGGTFAATPVAITDGRTRTQTAPQTSRDSKSLPWKTLIPIGFLAGLAAAFAVLAPKREKVVQSVVTTNVVERLVERTNVVTTVAHAESDAWADTTVRTKEGVYRWKGQEGEWTYRVRNGLASIGDGKGCALYPRPVGKLVLPSSLNGIPISGVSRAAFAECPGLKGVQIPEGYHSLERDAFRGCIEMVEVSLPESLARVGDYVFQGTRIARLDLKNVVEMGDVFFAGLRELDDVTCSSRCCLRRLDNGVLVSRDGKCLCFYPRKRKECILPDGVEEIGNFAFSESCIEKLSLPLRIRKIGCNAFRRCERLREIAFQGTVVDMDEKAFFDNPALKRVEIPAGFSSLNAWATFGRCPSLEEITLPDAIEEIGPDVFENDVKLKRVRLGKRLKTLGYRSFAGCSALEEVTIPASVRTMHPEVFRGCKSLRCVTFEGDAPLLLDNGEKQRGVDQFLGTDKGLEVIVSPGSRGWSRDESSTFPKLWPIGAGENARRIRCGDGEETAATPDAPLPVRESRSINAEKLKDSDPTRAVQKTLDVLFPGWKTTEAGGGQELGYRVSHCGVDDVLRSHPPCRGTPVTFSKTVAVAGRHPVLHVRLSNHAEGRQFRLRVRVGGRTAREMDIASGWTDVYVDLGKWRGKKAKIELDHLPTGWCQEWAYWSEIEIVDDATLVEVAAVQGGETPVKILDRKQVVGTNPRKAAQRTCDALFPGWKISECGHLDEAGYEEEHRGRYNLLFTHPPREDVPVVLSRRMNLPRKAPKLYVSAIGGEDFELQVKVNGKIVQRPDVNGREWTDLVVDLSEWAGRNVLLEVLNMPTGWQHEEAHWQRLEIR